MMRAGDYERDESGLLLPRRRGIQRAHPQWMAGPGFFGSSGPPVVKASFDSGSTGAGVTLSAANKTASCSGAGSARGDSSKSSGKWQAEFLVSADGGAGAGAAIIGFCQTSTAMSSYPGAVTTSWGYWNRTGNKFNNGASTAYGATYAPVITIDLVLDFTAGTATFYKNGVSQGSFTHGLTGALYFMVGNGAGGGVTPVYTVQDTLSYPVSGATQWSV
jgi:hypothetical protein